ncbi:hypothetical protein GCM10029992_31590 [Glycomyces albus]
MRFNKTSGALLAAAALMTTAACVSEESSGSESDDALVGEGTGADCVIEDTVKLGAVLSLTEGAAFAGEYQQQGLELAIEELNAQDGVTYELIVEDDATDVETGVAAFEKVIDRDQVSAIIGPTLSNTAFTTFPDSQSAGVPTVGISTTAEGIPEIGDYIFRASSPRRSRSPRASRRPPRPSTSNRSRSSTTAPTSSPPRPTTR